MGLLSRFAKDPPPTKAEGAVAEQDTAKLEKAEAVAHGGEGVQHQVVDPDLEKRVVRKIDTHLVPLVMALYLLAFLDRSNIGNAYIAGLEEDLAIDSYRYQWLLTIFYIAYIISEPAIVMWKVVRPHYWACFVTFVWGLCSTLQSAASSFAGLMVLRFLMGASEAAYGPGIPYLLSFFYLRHELGFRTGIFLAAAPLASTFAGALAYGITSGHSAIANWKVLFLVEGLPTICMAPIAFFFMPDSPDQAKFFNDEEKEVAKARVKRQVGHVQRIGGLVWKDVGLTLIDAKAWFTALMYFSCNVSFASLPVFLPTILEELGYESVDAQGLSAPPYFASFLVTIGTAWSADRTQQRGLTVMVLTMIGGTGYIILAATTSVGARYFAIFLVACGVFPAIANILPWVFNNQGTDTRRGIAGVMLNVVGQCGPILGTHLYPDADQPRYVKGHSTCAAFMFFTTLLALSLRTLLAWENKKLDKKYGTLEEQKAGIRKDGSQDKERVAKEGESAIGEENYGPKYRFVL